MARGKVRDADRIHRGSGDVPLYRLTDGSHLLRFENLNVTNGPDLRVLLTRHPDPSSSSEVKEGFLEVGKLKGNIGNQNYEIPAETDISEFQSVVIYCKAFGVLFSTAALR